MRLPPQFRRPVALLAFGLVVALAAGVPWACSRLQEEHWQDASVDELTARAPGNAAAAYWLGVRLRDSEKHSEAAEAFARAVAASPRESRGWEAWVLELIRLGRHTEAQEALGRMAVALPRSAFVPMTRAQFAEQAHDSQAAAGYYRRVAELAPRETDGWYHLGVVLGQAHQYEAAHAALRRAQSLEPANVDVLTALGLCDLDSGAVDEAVTTLRRAVALDPNHPEAGRYLGEALFVQPGPPQRLLEARDALRRAVATAPQFGPAWYWLGRVELERGQADEGVAALRQALRADPTDQAALQYLGQALVQQGHAAEGRAVQERFRRVARLNSLVGDLRQRSQDAPRDAELHLRMARLFATEGIWSEAAREFEEVLKLQPENKQVRREWAAARTKMLPKAPRDSGSLQRRN